MICMLGQITHEVFILEHEIDDPKVLTLQEKLIYKTETFNKTWWNKQYEPSADIDD